MKLTREEIKDIANRLDEIIGDNFHDAMYHTLFLRDSYEEIEVSDEDIEQIKQQLKRIL
jgi:shikimate 5-dehydrogenase